MSSYEICNIQVHSAQKKKFTCHAPFAWKPSKDTFCQNKGINQQAGWCGIQETKDTTEEKGEKNSRDDSEGIFQNQSNYDSSLNWRMGIEDRRRVSPKKQTGFVFGHIRDFYIYEFHSVCQWFSKRNTET